MRMSKKITHVIQDENLSRRVNSPSESDTGLLTTAIRRTRQVSKGGPNIRLATLPQRQSLLSNFRLVSRIEQAEIALQAALINDLKRGQP